MATNLLIVESPAKAKTLQKYLGKDFEILASYGHVRDLVPRPARSILKTILRCNTKPSHATASMSTR